MSAVLFPTVLLAEDSPDTRIMLKRALELKGFRVLEATNGREALEMIAIQPPNLIILDLNIPVLDGLETIKSVRSMQGSADQIPIVAITAVDVYGMEAAAFEAGCNEYIRKPFDLNRLYKAMNSLGFLV